VNVRISFGSLLGDSGTDLARIRWDVRIIGATGNRNDCKDYGEQGEVRHGDSIPLNYKWLWRNR
jgi:hypothetical protein